MGNTMARLKGFQKLTPTEDALQTWLNTLQVKKCKEVKVPLHHALNRILAENIIAKQNLPKFDRSAVDGYALKAESTTGASQFKPKVFHTTNSDKIDVNQAKQLWTGNPIPQGANAVVMLENTKTNAEEIEVWVQLTPGENISKKGEDIKKGETAVETGTRLNPYHLGLLAALGNTEVNVVEKPKIAILATGNELIKAGTTPSKSQIFEANRIILSAMCRELGAEPIDLGIAKDDVNEITEKLKMGLEKADAIITTGGTSVGAPDLVPEAVNTIGKPGVVVHGVAMRPAMPTALAVLERKPVMILSGNPVAAIMGFEVFARPLMFKMLGMEKEELRPIIKANMTRKVTTTLGRKTFVRVQVLRKNGDFFAQPISARGSGAISTMTRGNGYVVVPENREGLAQGESVLVYLFGYTATRDENV